MKYLFNTTLGCGFEDVGVVWDFEYDEDEWTDIDEIKNKQSTPSLDDLLEKIKEKGLNSLTEKELLQLNKYSN
jgi:hypothetical protein